MIEAVRVYIPGLLLLSVHSGLSTPGGVESSPRLQMLYWRGASWNKLLVASLVGKESFFMLCRIGSDWRLVSIRRELPGLVKLVRHFIVV